MKHIFKFIGIVLFTIYTFICEFSEFLWDLIWNFNLDKPFNILELTYTDYNDSPFIIDLNLNYQPDKPDSVFYEEYRTTFHYIWGFKPLTVKHKK